MKTRYLGNTGVRVSEICLGTLTFGGQEFYTRLGGLGQKEADTIVHRAIDAGVNFFDTADIYSGGAAEEILGKTLGSRRKDVIVAIKVRGRMGPGPNDVRLSRHHILEGCEASLKRMGTDYIDLYQVHSFDPDTPLEETLRALDDLVRQGKVRYIGCSNFTGWQLMKALAISEKLNLEKFVTLQAQYSLLSRDIEYDLVPLCLDQGLGILTWSPLSGGFLSGKYRRGQPRPQGARLSDPNAMFDRLDEEKGYDIIEALDKIAQVHNGTVAQAALNYLLCKPAVTSVIISARNPEQLADNLKTTDWEMTPEEVHRLDSLTSLPPLYPHSFLERSPHDN